jgi:hypothetical protein
MPFSPMSEACGISQLHLTVFRPGSQAAAELGRFGRP